MFDHIGLKAAQTKDQYKYRGSFGAFSNEMVFVRPRDLADGVYTMRLLPPWPERNPRGFRRVVTHQVQLEPEREFKIIWCLRAEDADCFVCDLLEILAESYKTYTEAQQRAIEAMTPFERFLFPITIDAMKDPTSTDKYPPLVRNPSGQSISAIWEIWQPGILRKLTAMLEQYPTLSDLQQGSYFQFTKNGKQYDLGGLYRKEPLQLQEAFTEAKYPRINKLYKKVHRWTYAEQYERIKNAWWAHNIPMSITENAPEAGILDDGDVPF